MWVGKRKDEPAVGEAGAQRSTATDNKERGGINVTNTLKMCRDTSYGKDSWVQKAGSKRFKGSRKNSRGKKTGLTFFCARGGGVDGTPQLPVETERQSKEHSQRKADQGIQERNARKIKTLL